MKIRPLGDRVLVEPIEEKEQTVGGIIIPDAAKEKPMQGKVIAVGKKLDKDGNEVKFDVKAGDTVLLPKYGGTEVKVGDKKLQLVREEDLLGVIEKYVNMSVGSTIIKVAGTYQGEKTVRGFSVSIPKSEENLQWLSKLSSTLKRVRKFSLVLRNSQVLLPPRSVLAVAT